MQKMYGEKKIKSECKYIGFKNNRLEYKCKECRNESAKSVKGLIRTFPIRYVFCNGSLSKFLLLLRKGVCPYEYMDSWEIFNKTLPPKKYFYSELNKEGITDEEYAHGEKVWKKFSIKDLGEYHDWYVQTITLLLPDVSENFRDTCLEIRLLYVSKCSIKV